VKRVRAPGSGNLENAGTTPVCLSMA
jgi:hypothetical protein